jgi:hypothetical protein
MDVADLKRRRHRSDAEIADDPTRSLDIDNGVEQRIGAGLLGSYPLAKFSTARVRPIRQIGPLTVIRGLGERIEESLCMHRRERNEAAPRANHLDMGRNRNGKVDVDGVPDGLPKLVV